MSSRIWTDPICLEGRDTTAILYSLNPKIHLRFLYFSQENKKKLEENQNKLYTVEFQKKLRNLTLTTKWHNTGTLLTSPKKTKGGTHDFFRKTRLKKLIPFERTRGRTLNLWIKSPPLCHWAMRPTWKIWLFHRSIGRRPAPAKRPSHCIQISASVLIY